MQPHTEADPVGRSAHVEGEIFLSASSVAMRAVHRTIEDIANTDVPVLLVGEAGTGKDTLARHIHRLSRRKHEPFTKINCAAIASDFFRTAGPVGPNNQCRLGPGTAFFDAVEELDIAHQLTLVDALSNAQASARSDRGRVISSTQSDLQRYIRDCCFREDLYYSLSGVCLYLPPLRQRKDDIPALVDFFLAKFSALQMRPKPHLSPAIMRVLLNYAWPGNIRELESAIHKLVTTGDESRVLADLRSRADNQDIVQAKPLSLKQVARSASRQAERELILQVLSRTRWNRKRAAQELQISYKALLYKLKQMELDSAVSER